MIKLTAEEKILASIKRDYPFEDCWLYLGALSLGYGLYCHKRAHRLSYEAYKGRIPKGTEIDHLCRNTRCINPDHLEPVTHRENTLRGFSPAAIHARKTKCPKGHPYDIFSNRKRRCSICSRAKSKARYYRLKNLRPGGKGE